MDNLTKANFWDRIERKYPEAFKIFSAWIDKYKEEVQWTCLFNAGEGCETDLGEQLTAPKFHEIPFEFQNGVIARFDIECLNGVRSGKGKAIYEANRQRYVQQFENLFADLQNQVNREKQ